VYERHTCTSGGLGTAHGVSPFPKRTYTHTHVTHTHTRWSWYCSRSIALSETRLSTLQTWWTLHIHSSDWSKLSPMTTRAFRCDLLLVGVPMQVRTRVLCVHRNINTHMYLIHLHTYTSMNTYIHTYMHACIQRLRRRRRRIGGKKQGDGEGEGDWLGGEDETEELWEETQFNFQVYMNRFAHFQVCCFVNSCVFVCACVCVCVCLCYWLGGEDETEELWEETQFNFHVHMNRFAHFQARCFAHVPAL
jgi:hypothetical protein